jgi:hypothetical protein
VASNYRIATGSCQTIDAAIAAISLRQNGNITSEQLHALGLDDSAIQRRVRAGRLFRVHRGVYAVGRPPANSVERAAAAVLACGTGAALSHASAMTLWGFWQRWERPFEVVVTGNRRPAAIKVHRSSTLAWRDIKTHKGIRVTSPARTMLDINPRLNDKQLKRALNGALHSPWLNESQMIELLGRCVHLPGAHRFGPLLGLPGTPTRSRWEDDFPEYCRSQGLPEPIMGAPVLGYIVDALFSTEKVIIELDSVEFHLDPIAFEVDRERDAVTLGAGYATVRITSERLNRTPDREGRRLHAILASRRQVNDAA